MNCQPIGSALAWRFIAWLALLSAWSAPRSAAAHDASYSYADVDWRQDRLTVALSVHRDDAAAALRVATPESLMSASYLQHAGAPLARLLIARLRVRADGRALELHCERATAVPERRAVRLELTASPATPAGRLQIEARLFPDNALHETFLNVYSSGRLLRQVVLTTEAPAVELYDRSPAGLWAVVRTFVAAGMHHVWIGPDHILFIVGLLLLGGGLVRVLKIATAFTVAHSITLACAATGVLNVPSRVVEPLIAASIVYIGIENLRRRHGAPDRRTLLAFGFGLVHGLGFASVLRELGLPREALGVSLLAFNLGVEAGQTCIVLAVTPLLAWICAQRPRIAPRVLAVGSLAIIVAGGFWLVQRIVAPAS